MRKILFNFFWHSDKLLWHDLYVNVGIVVYDVWIFLHVDKGRGLTKTACPKIFLYEKMFIVQFRAIP